MSAVSEDVGGALAICGCAVAALATAALCFARSPEVRLHFLAPVTTLAGPFIAAGLITYNGLTLSSAEVALTVAVLGVTGAAVTASIGRAMTERSRPQRNEEPE